MTAGSRHHVAAVDGAGIVVVAVLRSAGLANALEPRGVATPQGRKSRTVIAVDVGESRGPADADGRVAIAPSDEVDGLGMMRAAVQGRTTGDDARFRPATELARRMTEARYVAIVADGEPGTAPADFTLQYSGANRVVELRFAKPLERFRTVKVDLLDGILGTTVPFISTRYLAGWRSARRRWHPTFLAQPSSPRRTRRSCLWADAYRQPRPSASSGATSMAQRRPNR